LLVRLPWPFVWLTGETGSPESFSDAVRFLIESRLPFLLGECFSAEKSETASANVQKRSCKLNLGPGDNFFRRREIS
jgi:hypothetical protein